MKLLLDTNVCVHQLRVKGDARVKQRFAAANPSHMVLCTPVISELLYGAAKSAKPAANAAQVETLVAPFQVIPFELSAARELGRLRALLESQGQPISVMDAMIAAIALVHGLTLVTHNTAEFSRVPGLVLEDWETP